MSFPQTRMRRLRSSENIRRLVRETSLSVDDFIYPLFVVSEENVKRPINSMPGIWQFSVDKLAVEIEEIVSLGIKAVLLFGLPDYKDNIGSASWQDEGVVQRAIREIKTLAPDLLVIGDVCLCEYTDHGHCGYIENNRVDNDRTLELLGKQAVSYAKAGCDIIAPSDMMDGRIGYIREKLDNNDFKDTIIMSYAAKYASAFYGPFREAADSAPQFGDRRAYQMDAANVREALREVKLDIEEGADIVMVKPALAYLDVLRAVKDEFHFPTAAYNVSGEYSMIKAAALKGWIDEERVMMEVLTSMKRAGADMIITYFAKDAARLLNSK
ncbi:MAG TPA: porphobilinogen synthase [Syntrophomonadaceae bacterium]|jgi:porphobilinogen synthase|nr:porphobilinogen synthase [Syntrophomonadaceae bacterium]HRX20464.1 porphobilinogen synthase [Syntrophomonadaceae bacterium]